MKFNDEMRILLGMFTIFFASYVTTDNYVAEKHLENITNLAEMSLKEMISYPVEQWSKVKDEELVTMTSEQSAVFLEKIKSEGSIATWSRLVYILQEKLARPEVMKIIKSTSTLNGTFAKQIAQSLGDRIEIPMTWNATILNELNSSLLNFFPSDVMHNWPTEAQHHYLQLMEHDHCRSVDQQLVVYKLIEHIYGSTSSWRQINESIANWLPSLSPLQLNKLDITTVANNLQTINNGHFQDRDHAQPIIAKAIASLQSEANLSLTRDLFQNLSNLITFVRLTDVEHFGPEWFQDSDVQRMLINNNNKDELLRRQVLMLSKPEDGQWAENDVTRLQDFLQSANNHMLMELSSKRLLGRQALQAILNDSILDSWQVNVLKGTAEVIYKHGEHWDITTMPARLLPGIARFDIISSEEIAMLRPEDVVNQMDNLNAVSHLLDAEQMTAITDKLIELGLDRVSKVEIRPNADFMRMISTQQMSTLDKKTTLQLIRNMPAESLHARNYIEKVYTKKNITLEDIRNDPVLANSMNCHLLDGFRDDQILEVLMALHTTATKDLKPKLSKCLADKLRKHLRSRSKNGQTDDETQMLYSLTPTELGIVGGQVLVHFSAYALQEQAPETKCRQIFFLIGQLPLTTINMLQPYEKKGQLARAAVNCLDMREGKLDLADMSVIGNLMGYLPETAINKMSYDAFALNLPLLSGQESLASSEVQLVNCGSRAAEHTVAPCLRPEMRQALRRKLTTVMGQPDSWNETQLRTIGCLLTTLFPDELRQMKNDVLVSAADHLDRCWRTNLPSKAWDQDGIFRLLCKNELLGAILNVEEAEKHLRQRLKGAIVEHSRAHGTSDDFKRLNCQMIRRAPVAVLSEASVNEVESLTRKDILDCLGDIGKFPIGQEKATVLWNKVKQAYGKTASNMDPSVYQSMGFVMQGLNLAEMATLHLNNTNIINAFGRFHNFTSEQLHALAVQVKADYQSDAERFKRKDWLTFEYIICGFHASDIDKMSTKLFLDISFRMSDQLSTCDSEVKAALAKKAVQGFGEPRNWTTTTVASIGYIIGGLTLDQLASINGESFEGLSPKFVEGIPPEKLKGLKLHQLEFLSVEAVNYLAPDQLKHLDTDQLQVVNKLKSLYNRGPSSYTCIAKWILLITIILLV